jgi:hypothetical protein
MTGEQWVDLIISRAADLRSAGVQQISVDGASVVLLPSELAPLVASGAVPSGPAERSLLDPFDDPETFGGVMPGYEFPATPPGELE